MSKKREMSKEEIEQWDKFMKSGKELPLKPADFFNRMYNSGNKGDTNK
jgi:hypothetical protein